MSSTTSILLRIKPKFLISDVSINDFPFHKYRIHYATALYFVSKVITVPCWPFKSHSHSCLRNFHTVFILPWLFLHKLPMIWILTSSKSIFLSLINRLLSLKPEHFLYQLSCFLFHFAGSILFHYLIKSKCDKLTIYYNFVLYQKGKKRNPLEM